MVARYFDKFGLWHEGVFVMSDLWRAFWREHYCNDIETERPVVDIVGSEKEACCPE